MLSCQHVMAQLDDYVDHSLSREQYQAIWNHLDSCPACAERLQQAIALREQLKTLPSPELPPDFAARQLQRFWQQQALQAQRPAPHWPWAMAASLLLGVVLGGGLVLWSGAQPRHNHLAAQGETFILAQDEIRQLRLDVNASENLPGATLSLRLPANAELVDYPGERELTWQADLKQGSNLLILPLRAQGSVESELVLVVLSPSGRQQTKVLRLGSVLGLGAPGKTPPPASHSI